MESVLIVVGIIAVTRGIFRLLDIIEQPDALRRWGGRTGHE